MAARNHPRAPAPDRDTPFFESVLLADRVRRTVSAAEIERRGGMPVGETVAIWEAFGFPAPRPDAPTFTEEEAAAFVEITRAGELWPPDLRRQVSRVYALALAQIARAEVHGFREHTMAHVHERADDPREELSLLRTALERLLPLADPLLLGVHRRWVEYELAQAAVGEAEQRSGSRPLPGATEVSFLFCDLKDFTAYVERAGDARAIQAIDRFFECVEHERGEAGQVVKALGDGVMLAYEDPAEAVDAGARILRAMRADDLPGVHASVHHGRVIARHGDYFGGAVNLAARLLGLGDRDELIATEPVVAACGDRLRWESLGHREIRGLGHPIGVYRLLGA